tara:strand:- start:7964 stop:9187 length:1224 start_codon:yes stop_codon:yes gene_type:complete
MVLNQIKNWSVYNQFKQTARYILAIANRFIICPVLWIIYKTTGTKVSVLYSARIAHLAYNGAAFFYRLKVQMNEVDKKRLVFSADPCNRQLFEMWKRYIPILESRVLFFWFNADIHYLRSKPYIEYLPFLHTEFEEMDQMPALEFTAREQKKGKALLETMGIPDNAWFICFQARDDMYHHKVRGTTGTHPHRNSEIDTYLKAARMIGERGGYALRMGAWADEPLSVTRDPHIIDYARDHRSDFGDIYLFGNAKFFLASSAGTFPVSTLFKVPVILANQTPPRLWPIGRYSLMAPKMMVYKGTNALVPFSELEKMGAFDYNFSELVRWDMPETFEDYGIVPRDNSADELVEASLDMLDALDGQGPSEDAREVQQFYKSKYCKSAASAAEFGPELAPSFALKYRDIILN